MSRSKLAVEIGKRRPFESLREEALLNLFRTMDRFQIHFLRLFRVFAITPSQYNILRILRGEGKPLPILEIADRMITVAPGITGLIDRLEAAGLVERRRCEHDRRVIHIAITESASKLLSKIDEPLEQLHHKLLGHFSQSELRVLIGLLEKARESVADNPE